MKRLLTAILIGTGAGLVCYVHLARFGHAADFTWVWRAARLLLAGQNPYTVIRAGGPYPFDAPLYYPLPTVVLALPLAPLPAPLAGALFVGISSALLAFGLTKEGWGGLLLFLSAPYVFALVAAQWSILLTAALLLPALGPVLAAKPTLGAATIAARPSWPRLILSALFALVSLAVLPSWPLDWLRNVRAQPLHSVPALICPLLLLAALRWRSWRARLLLALALVPQRLLWYDQLALGLIPETTRRRLVWLVSGWLSRLLWLYAGADWDNAAWYVILGVYLPALIYALNPLHAKRA